MTKDKDYNKINRELRKLISEEFLAWQLYTQFIFAAAPEEGAGFAGLFAEIAKDELDDHLNKLVSYAKQNGYDVPCTNEEYQKYAGDEIVKQFTTKIKKNEDLCYYIDEAIAAEEAAIQSYAETLEVDELPDDLYQIILEIYYEESEHLRDLTTLKFAAECENGPAELIYFN